MARRRNLVRTGRFPLHKRIGDFVDAERMKRGLDYKEIALRMGRSQSQVSKLVAGDAKWTAEHILEIAAALDLSPIQFINAGRPQDQSPADSKTSPPVSGPALKVPAGLNKYLGDFGDDVTPRERRWLEKIEENTDDVGAAAPKFWDEVLRAYREFKRTQKPSR